MLIYIPIEGTFLEAKNLFTFSSDSTMKALSSMIKPFADEDEIDTMRRNLEEAASNLESGFSGQLLELTMYLRNLAGKLDSLA